MTEGAEDAEEIKLKKTIERLLTELKIADQNQLPEVIINMKKCVQCLKDILTNGIRNENQVRELEESQQRLRKCEEVQQMIVQLEILSRPKTQEEILNEKIIKSLLELQLSQDKLPEAISVLKNYIACLASMKNGGIMNDNQAKQLEESQVKLQRCEEVQQMIVQLEILSRPKTQEEILHENILESLLELQLSQDKLPEAISVLKNYIECLICMKNGGIMNDNQAKQLEESQGKLQRCEEVQQMIVQLEVLSRPKTQKEILHENITKSLEELQMSQSKLPEAISVLKNYIKCLISMQSGGIMDDNQAKELEQNQKKLQKCEEVQQMIFELEKLSRPKTQKEIVDERDTATRTVAETDLGIDSMSVLIEEQTQHLESESKEVECLSNTSELPEVKETIHISPEFLFTMPDCAIKLVITTILQLQNNEAENIETVIEEIRSKLYEEHLFSHSIQEKICDLKKNLNDSSNLVKYLQVLLKEIQPLNVHEISYLIKKADEAAAKIENQDIVLLIGETGVGKSTAILYLSKQRLGYVPVPIDGGVTVKDHIAPIGPLKYRDLQRIIPGARSKSGTKFISTVSLPLRDIWSYSNETIILCDAAGFGDTEGAEVDIANSIALLNAVSKCKSVKILAMTSYKDFGSKGQGIQKLVRILGDNINDITTWLPSITYGLTRVPVLRTPLSDILSEILSTKSDSNIDSAFKAIMVDMIEKAKKNNLLLDPLDENPEPWLKMITSSTGIEYPNEVFQFSMSESSRSKVVDQILQYKTSIEFCMKSERNDLLLYYLDNFTTLHKLIQRPFVGEVYNATCQTVKEHFQKMWHTVKEKYNGILKAGDLTEEHIQEYKKYCDIFFNLHRLKLDNHFDLVPLCDIQSFLSGHFESLIKIIEIYPFHTQYKQENEELQNLSRKFHLTTKNMREMMKSHYIDAQLNNCANLIQYFPELKSVQKLFLKTIKEVKSKLESQIVEYIKDNNFKCISFPVKGLKIFEIDLQHHTHCDLSRSVILSIPLKLWDFVTRAKQHYCSTYFTTADSANIEEFLSILTLAKENSYLQQTVNNYVHRVSDPKHKTIDNIHSAFLDDLEGYFNSIVQCISQIFSHTDSFTLTRIGNLTNSLDLIRKIPGITPRTDPLYIKIKEDIRSHINELQNEADNLLTNFQSGNYKKLVKAITTLKSNSEWINLLFSDGTVMRTIETITEQLNDYGKELVKEMESLDLSLQCHKNLEQAKELMAKIELIGPLESCVDGLKEHRTNFTTILFENVQKQFDYIQKTFSLEDNTIYQYQKDVRVMEEILAECEEKHPAKIEMKKYNFESIDSIQQEIEKRGIIEESESKKLRQKINDLKLELEISKSDPGSVPQFKLFSKSAIKEKKKETQAKINELALELREFEQESQYKINSLIKLKKDLEDNAITQPQLEFLKGKNYSSLPSLKRAIKEKQIRIANQEKRELEYWFKEKMDPLVAQQAIEYLDGCEQLRKTCFRESNFLKSCASTKQLLRSFISRYVQVIMSELKFTLTEVKSKIHNSASALKESELSTTLAARSRELVTLNSRYSSILAFASVNCSALIDDFAVVLRTKLDELDRNDDDALLNKNLAESGVLRVLDDAFNLLPNGFGKIHDNLRRLKMKDFRDNYSNIVDSITKQDFASVALKLENISDPLDPKPMEQIKLDLESTLNKIMDVTKAKIFRLKNRFDLSQDKDFEEQLEKINEGLSKIGLVASKQSILNVLDDEFSTKVKNFVRAAVTSMVDDVIKNGLTTARQIIQGESFRHFEAENALDTIDCLNRYFEEYLASIEEQMRDIKRQYDELVVELEQSFTKIGDRNIFHCIEKFSQEPPKSILTRLQMFNRQRYAEATMRIIQTIKTTVITKIDDIRKAPFDSQPAEIRKLRYALKYLTPELQEECEIFLKQLEDDRKDTSQEISSKIASLKVTSTKFQTVDEFVKLSAEIDKKKSTVHAQQLENQLNETVAAICDKYENEPDLEIALNEYFKTVNHYKKKLPTHEYTQTKCKDALYFLKKGLHSCLTIIDGLFQDDEVDPLVVKSAYEKLRIYGNFFSTPQQESDFAAELLQITEAMNNLNSKFTRLYEDYSDAIKRADISELERILQSIKPHTAFIALVKKKNANIKDYNEYLPLLCAMIDEIESRIDVELINTDTTWYPAERENHFTTIDTNLKKMMECEKKISIYLGDADLKLLKRTEEVRQCLQQKLERVCEQLDNTTKNLDGILSRDCDRIRNLYNHLQAIGKCIKDMKFKDLCAKSQVEVESKLTKQGEKLEKRIASASDIPTAVENLLALKLLEENIDFVPNFKAMIDSALRSFKKDKRNKGIQELCMKLELSDEGNRIIADHSALSSVNWRRRRQKMEKQDDIDYVLDKLKGDSLDKNALRSRYKTFKTLYEKLLLSYQTKIGCSDTDPLDTIVSETKFLAGKVFASSTRNWNSSVTDKIPGLMAYVCAIWTCKNSDSHNEVRGICDKDFFLLMPHAVQIVSILRIFGIGYQKERSLLPFGSKPTTILTNNFVEVGTGEGKSVILAVSACIFALLGYQVNCSCYSEHLSQRDKKQFSSIFIALGIEDRITYGTFNQLCEDFINQHCNVREKLKEALLKNETEVLPSPSYKQMRERVLLVDEVDVFLSDKFFGGTYNPSFLWYSPEIKELLDFVWEKKPKNVFIIKDEDVIRRCTAKYSNWSKLIEEALKEMIAALSTYSATTYTVTPAGKIGYLEGESYVDNIMFGYATIWAYYSEYEKGNITPDTLVSNTGIIVNSGTFSYAEIPLNFSYISGVSGTLHTLSDIEKDLLFEKYNVSKLTFTPSVFGKTNREILPTIMIKSSGREKFYSKIVQKLEEVIACKRAALVFFEDEAKLNAFLDFEFFKPHLDNVQLITEKISESDRELFIKRAAAVRKITLLTKAFGRGTDFICTNQELLLSGGVFVIQTFYSAELSEEVQIRGRCARQGDSGSYMMILLESELEFILGPDWKSILKRKSVQEKMLVLDTQRSVECNAVCSAKLCAVKQYIEGHNKAFNFLRQLAMGKVDCEFILAENKGVTVVPETCRTIILMDATGSMGRLLAACKDTIFTVFERASNILEDRSLPSDAFQVQCVVYRDYDCGAGVLQASNWESKPANLRTFMSAIGAQGGGDYEEAVEIGLWHCNNQHDSLLAHGEPGIAQIIIIGDAPAKDEPAIVRDRARYGEEWWQSNTPYKKPTHWMTEMEQLRSKDIPIHAFYLHEGCRTNFIAIAQGGRAQPLNIDAPDGADHLTDLVTKQILERSAGAGAVEDYDKKYTRRTFTS